MDNEISLDIQKDINYVKNLITGYISVQQKLFNRLYKSNSNFGVRISFIKSQFNHTFF